MFGFRRSAGTAIEPWAKRLAFASADSTFDLVCRSSLRRGDAVFVDGGGAVPVDGRVLETSDATGARGGPAAGAPVREGTLASAGWIVIEVAHDPDRN